MYVVYGLDHRGAPVAPVQLAYGPLATDLNTAIRTAADLQVLRAKHGDITHFSNGKTFMAHGYKVVQRDSP